MRSAITHENTRLRSSLYDKFFEAWRQRVLQWWSADFDLLLTSTAWKPPVILESMMPVDSKLLELRGKIGRHMFFIRQFKVTGQLGQLRLQKEMGSS